MATRTTTISLLAGVRLLFWRWLPLMCALLALALIPPSYPGRELWSDEAFTVSYARHADLWTVLEDVRKNEETPPFSFTVVWLWARLAGPSVESVRLLSMLYGLAAIALITWMAQRALGNGGGLVAGLALAASPVVGTYLFEARAYTITLLLGVGCMILFERLRDRPTDRAALVGYAFAGAALLLTSYLGIALIAAHNLLWLSRFVRRRAWRAGGWRESVGWVVAQVGVGAPMLLWLPVLLGRLEIISEMTPFVGVTPLHHIRVTQGLLLDGAPRTGWLAVWLPATLALWALVIAGVLDERRRGEGRAVRWFVAPLVVLVSTLIAIEAIGPRYLILAFPGAALAMAAGWVALRPRRPRLAHALVAVAVGGMLLLRAPSLVAPPREAAWQPVAATVARGARPGDAVIFQPPFDLRTFAYYYDGPELPLIGAHHYDDFYVTQGYDFMDTWTNEEAAAAARGHARVWVVQNSGGGTRPDLPFPLVGSWEAGGLRLRLYEVP